jgi:hypothetical protein
MGGSILQATGRNEELIASSTIDYKAKLKALSELASTKDFYPSIKNQWKFPL